jgi:hypothetical protein
MTGSLRGLRLLIRLRKITAPTSSSPKTRVSPQTGTISLEAVAPKPLRPPPVAVAGTAVSPGPGVPGWKISTIARNF